MRMNAVSKSTRKPTNISLDAEKVREAKKFGLSVSRACETGLDAALKAERVRRWLEENREAIEAWNLWVKENGLPLAKYRRF